MIENPKSREIIEQYLQLFMPLAHSEKERADLRAIIDGIYKLGHRDGELSRTQSVSGQFRQMIDENGRAQNLMVGGGGGYAPPSCCGLFDACIEPGVRCLPREKHAAGQAIHPPAWHAIAPAVASPETGPGRETSGAAAGEIRALAIKLNALRTRMCAEAMRISANHEGRTWYERPLEPHDDLDYLISYIRHLEEA